MLIKKYEDMTDDEKAVDKAYDIMNEIEQCMSDLACGDEIEADRMYDDPDVMSDMFCDRCFEASGLYKTEESEIFGLMICDEVIERAHPALKKAAIEYRERHCK